MSVQPEGEVYRVGDNQKIWQRQYVAKVVMSPIPALSSSKAALTICSNDKSPIIYLLSFKMTYSFILQEMPNAGTRQPSLATPSLLHMTIEDSCLL